MISNNTSTEPYAAAVLPDTAKPRDASSTPWLVWSPFAAIAILLAVIYYRVAIKLVYDWYTIPDYSHGFLVPFFALFLLWDKRKALRSIPVQQSWGGIPLVVFAIALLILGVYGVDLFTARISFVLLLAGLIWTLPPPGSRSCHPVSNHPLQPDHLPAPALCLPHCERDPASAGRSRAARGQCDTASRNEAGGCRSL
jgi:hypothetical protein